MKMLYINFMLSAICRFRKDNLKMDLNMNGEVIFFLDLIQILKRRKHDSVSFVYLCI